MNWILTGIGFGLMMITILLERRDSQSYKEKIQYDKSANIPQPEPKRSKVPICTGILGVVFLLGTLPWPWVEMTIGSLLLIGTPVITILKFNKNVKAIDSRSDQNFGHGDFLNRIENAQERENDKSCSCYFLSCISIVFMFIGFAIILSAILQL